MNKDEQVTVSPVGDPTKVQSYSRKQFYEEQFAGNHRLAVHVIDIILFDTNGDMILQKRSHTKAHNPGLLDKSIGGHIVYGDTPNYTVMVESIQELLTPSIAARDHEEFTKIFNLLRDYTETISIVELKEMKEWTLDKLHDGQLLPVNNVVYMYFGVYDGRMRPADREAAGMLYYSFDRLQQEIAEHPQDFTDDLIQMCRTYESEIIDFQHQIQSFK